MIIMRFLLGIMLGALIAFLIAIAFSPVSFWGSDRDWSVFLETQRKGIDLMHAGSVPDRTLVTRNRALYDGLVAAGEIAVVSAPADQASAVLEWMKTRGIQQYAPLDVLMGGQNTPGRIGIPKSTRTLVEDFVKSINKNKPE